MKKWYILFLIALFISSYTLGVYADDDDDQHGNGHRHHNSGHHNYGQPNNGPGIHYGYYNHLQDNARYVIHRTALVLRDAQRAAGRRHYSYGLARAIAHQQMAIRLYRNGIYQDAIFYSLRARNLAFQVIRGNREMIRHEYEWDEMEDDYRYDSPDDDDLDRNVNWRRYGSDDQVVHITIEFDINL